MTSGTAAVLLAAAAGWLVPRGAPQVLDRLGISRVRHRPGADVALVLGLLVGGMVVAGPGGALAAAGVPLLVRRHLRRRTAARREDQLRDALGELLAALAAELRGGAEPRSALVTAAAGLPALEPVAATASTPSGDVPSALRALGRASTGARAGSSAGASAGELAAAWLVAERSGCALAAPTVRVLRGHRSRDRLRQELAAELAGPRATARLLAVLPLLGVALGASLGADPLGFLFGDGPGRVVLVAGVTLDIAGLAWTRRIVTSAERLG